MCRDFVNVYHLCIGGDPATSDGVITIEYIALHMENVTTRMSEEELDLLKRLAEETGTSRSDAIRRALRRGASEELITLALQRYQDGEVGMRGAADIAGLTIAEMMAEANERGVLSNYDEASLADDVDALR